MQLPLWTAAQSRYTPGMPDSSFSLFDPPARARLRQKLLRWFARCGRPLPWRQTHDPYPVWISEIMLQQTTVQAVLPYFERFLQRFPTLSALASASEQEVLKLWEGLGYYSRGRNLHRTAQVIVSEHGGQFPSQVEQLQRLPGIGRYTAGAIASFAFDRPAPILEANTLRLYCRLLGYEGNPYDAAGQKLLWTFAESLLPRRGAGKVNQALMELGSQICTPSAPQCPHCPVREGCRAAAMGRVNAIPQPKPRGAVTAIVEGCVALWHGDRVLLLKRQPHQLWAGLWDFPRAALSELPHQGRLAPHQTDLARHQLKEVLRREWNVEAIIGGLIREIRHTVTRYRIRLLCFSGQVDVRISFVDREFSWITPAELLRLPLSTSGRKLAQALVAHQREESPS